MQILKASDVITGDGSNTAILTPTTGARFTITHYALTVDVGGVITVYDQTNNSANRIVYGYLSPGIAGLFPFVIGDGHVLRSAAVDNVLYANVPTGTKLYWQIHYYESD